MTAGLALPEMQSDVDSQHAQLIRGRHFTNGKQDSWETHSDR